VPKDTKKFINPLLRPSQESSPRIAPSTVPELESQNVPDEMATNASSSDTPLPSAIDGNATEVKTASNLGPQNAPELDTELENEQVPMPTRKARVTSSTNANREGDDEQTEEASANIVSRAGSSARRSSSAAAINLDTVPRSTPTVSSRQAKKTGEVEDALSSAFSGTKAQDKEEDPAKVGQRRRRGTQPFEMTHERITLWIDKQLKQDFEDLAYDRNLSKSALLNEAIGELLKKYEPR
jgi:hypothetical protein